MTKHEKRLQKARNNPKDLSYPDFISILENEGYTVRMTKGSHRVATKMVGDSKFTITFAEPHGKRKAMNHADIKLLLEQLEAAQELREDTNNDD